jgi:hypothetical protein
MIPVAVSVPDNLAIQIEMETINWAFGKIRGTPRN